ncbi:MAG: hypothetical protein DSZ33_07010 [Gammaproteobacteria bacterium]|nr:MAG: hypothetical protein DSZ33_07010 [Gammaproteobacteria bacterium]
MNPVNKNKFLILLGLSLMLFVQHSSAETLQDRKIALLLEYLAADLQIIEGVGLQRIKLGDPMSKVRTVFGQTRTARELVTDSLVLEASLDANTRLRVTGRQRVRKMAFKGNQQSPYTTQSGARFGMPAYEVITTYGPAVVTDKDKGKTLTYPRKGIRFRIQHGVVDVIEVFPPSS